MSTSTRTMIGDAFNDNDYEDWTRWTGNMKGLRPDSRGEGVLRSPLDRRTAAAPRRRTWQQGNEPGASRRPEYGPLLQRGG
jgi:hypothetical protein